MLQPRIRRAHIVKNSEFSLADAPRLSLFGAPLRIDRKAPRRKSSRGLVFREWAWEAAWLGLDPAAWERYHTTLAQVMGWRENYRPGRYTLAALVVMEDEERKEDAKG
jgi:hypothetical protein